MIKAVVIIPARYGSTRLFAKALLKETGKYMVQHTYEQVKKCRNVSRIIIATDDERIKKAAQSFGAEVRMTSPKHTCGTERIAEVVRSMPAGQIPYIINVQGDEPEINPGDVDRMIDGLHKTGVDMTTLACPIGYKKDLVDFNKVKVKLDKHGFALWFKRVIKKESLKNITTSEVYRHLGVYGYKRRSLIKFTSLAPTPSEIANRLEQLRALDNGFRIKVILAKDAHYGIDTKEDYMNFIERTKIIKGR
ncbi:MAG: 3-deoxy-manno-octulosonate cytidylyltransferase [Candidatus Brocadiia bacterium]